MKKKIRKNKKGVPTLLKNYQKLLKLAVGKKEFLKDMSMIRDKWNLPKRGIVDFIADSQGSSYLKKINAIRKERYKFLERVRIKGVRSLFRVFPLLKKGPDPLSPCLNISVLVSIEEAILWLWFPNSARVSEPLTRKFTYAILLRRIKEERGVEEMGLCNDQAVGRLVELLHEVPADQRDDVFVKAKNQLTKEAKRAQRNYLEKLFDSQIQTLKDRGCPEQILEMARQRKTEVVQKASEMTIPEGHIPFVGPVIKPAYLSYYGLMAMVRNGDKEGYIYLDPSKVTDEVETPDGLYWLYDVEDGQAMLGKSMQDAEKEIKKQGRSPVTAAEAVIICILTDVLTRHFVDASGSRYGRPFEAPGVCLGYGDRPKLYWLYVDDAHSQWGSASCGSR